MTSRPSDPGVVKMGLLPPDWESLFFNHSFNGFVERERKKKANWPSMFSVPVWDPAEETKSDQTQGIDYITYSLCN